MSRLKTAAPAGSKNASFRPYADRNGEAFDLIERYLKFAGAPGLVTGMSFFFVQGTQQLTQDRWD